jgi:hypothetical protein
VGPGFSHNVVGSLSIKATCVSEHRWGATKNGGKKLLSPQQKKTFFFDRGFSTPAAEHF